MSSGQNQAAIKQYPFNRIKVTIHKIVEVTIPALIELLDKHSSRIEEYKNERNWDLVYREQLNAAMVVKQLKCSVEELERLKYQVVAEDYQLLENELLPIQKRILDAINEFIEHNGEISDPFNEPSEVLEEKNESNSLSPLDKDDCTKTKAQCTHEDKQAAYKGNNSSGNFLTALFPFLDRKNRQRNVDLDDLTTNEEHRDFESNVEIACDVSKGRNILQTWNTLMLELSSLNSMVHTLASVISSQKKEVNNIEAHVENVALNVEKGTHFLSKAAMAKALWLPTTLTLAGGMVGGPVGLFLGMKCGAAAAAAGGLTGYFGGKALQRRALPSNELEMETFKSSPEKTSDEKKND